jgi:protein-S-isoprenylcysteine O-methyltransferase Ste14
MIIPNDGVEEPKQVNQRRLILLLVAQLLFLALLLFLPAGTLGWRKGWLFLLVYVAGIALVVPYIWHVNPELLAARSRIRWAKRWDRILGSFLIATEMAIIPVAAMDDGRFHWLPTPPWVCGIGYVLLLVSTVFLIWVGSVNKFAEPAVRIQTERGHKVIDTGPYAIVRHPSYVAAVPLFAGIALALGSLWALVPVGLTSCLLILRTHWEDQTLQAELPGYREYTARVRYKLIPGVW